MRSRQHSKVSHLLLPLVGLLLMAAPVCGQTIPNSSFEANADFVLGQGHIGDNVPIVSWDGAPANLVGLNPAGGFNIMADNGTVPNGTRVAFLQSNGGVTSTLSTTITGLVAGMHYRVQFRVNCRAASFAPRASYRLNGGPAVPCRLHGPVGGANPYETVTGIFTATGPTAALEISNTTIEDSVLLVDNVTISTPTVITVTNANNGGAGSLRAAMETAAGTAAFNRIVFAPALNGAPIFFTQEETHADASGVVIDASALPDGVDLRGSLTNPVFNLVNPGTACLMIGLRLADGRRDVGGVVLNEATLTMRRCRFDENESTVAGGAIYNYNEGSLELIECTFVNNSTEGDGGAICNVDEARVLVDRCLFWHNDAENGNGGAIDAESPVDVQHSTFVENITQGKGGAIHGSASLKHCTLWQNLATVGRGIYVIEGGAVTCGNSIVAGNGSDDITNGGTFTRVGANIIQNFTPLPGSDQDGPPATNLNPQLSSLANNGGPTATAAIAFESPARNAAEDSAATSDQRGKPIIGTADIGAYEMQAGTFVLGGPAAQKTSEGHSFSVTIHRVGDATGPVGVRLRTVPGTATAADYTERPNTAASDVTFEDGDLSKVVQIPITIDRLMEGNHTFTVTLSLPTATPGADLGGQTSVEVTIADPVVVTNLNGSGTGSLPAALLAAWAQPGPDSIIFAPELSGGTITLSAELVLGDPNLFIGGDPLLIDGFGLPGGITLDGGPGANRVIAVRSHDRVTLRSLTVTGGNGGSSGGGGIRSSGLLTLERCAVSGNTSAGDGGGIFNAGIMTLRQCTISGNTAANSGGGLFTQVLCTVIHCTIAENTATTQTGGGIHNTSTIVLENSIVGDNSAGGQGDDIRTDGPLMRVGTNYVDDLAGPGALLGTGSMLTDPPQIEALANNGGPTRTHALKVTSPARNAATTSAILSDQRGAPVVGLPDVGAFEIQSGRFSLSASTYKTLEGSPAVVTIHRGNEAAGAVTVRLVTTNGTATAPADYEGRANSVTADIAFADGEKTKEVNIPTVADFLVEGNQTFTVMLSMPAPAEGAALGTPLTSTVTIVDPIQVTQTNDDGAGSLRQAFAAAKANSGPDAIHFAPALNGKSVVLGGQIDIDDAGGVTVDASNLSAGLTFDGGPGRNRIFVVGNSVLTPLTLRHLTLTSGGGAPGAPGGAMALGNATLVMDRCTIFGCAAGTGGGAIWGGNAITLNQCTLSGNSAVAQGGAVFTAGHLTLTHCTVTGNTTGGTGAGIYHTAANPSVEFTMERSIVAKNTGTIAGADIHKAGVGGFTLLGVSLVNSFLVNGSIGGSGSMVDVDPKLDPLAANGGPTRTHALQPDSPARDAGAASSITSDQRGLPVAGDVPDIGAFEVQTGGSFVLGQSNVTVLEGNPVQVTIRRDGGYFGSASVRLFTTNGTAKSPGDFVARPNDANAVVDFADGELEKTVIIDTVADPAVVEPRELFTVSLGSATDGATIGVPSSGSVVIFDFSASAGEDLTAPGVPVISSPAAGAGVGAEVGGTLTVTGSVADNKGVGGVEVCDAAGAVLATATLAAPGATSSTWTANITPTSSGNLTIKARSTDVAGNASATFSATRIFKVLRPLLVNIAGVGTVTAGFAPKSFREVGKPFTITATPGAGYIFAFWEVLSGHTTAELGVSGAALEKNTLTFVHRTGLALRAKFVANPYVPALVGTFNGSIKANPTLPDRAPAGPGGGDGTEPALDTEGYITLLVQGTGAFSGSLKVDGMTLAVAGVFDHEGVARFGTSRARTLSVPRAGKTSLAVSLLMDLVAPNFGEVRGSVWQFDEGAIVAQSDVLVERAAFSSANPVPAAPFLGVGGANGIYTVVFRSPGGDPAAVAQGHGYGTVTLTRTGSVSVVGTLADGVAFTASTTLSSQGRWRLFAPLYGVKGVVTGEVMFDFNNPNHDFSAEETLWVRPTQDVQHYPAGWQQALVATHGAKYVVTPGESVVPGLEFSSFGPAHLIFTEGLLPTPLTREVDISSADKVSNTSPDIKLAMTINRSTGTFSGSFTHSDATRPAFKGVVFQKVAVATDPCGFGFFLTTAPAVRDYTGQSGSVLLAPEP